MAKKNQSKNIIFINETKHESFILVFSTQKIKNKNMFTVYRTLQQILPPNR
jgi:hypothetical protein